MRISNIWSKFKIISFHMRTKSKVRSHIFFLAPLAIALYHQLWIYTILIALVIIFSTAYHRSNEKRYHIRDNIFAYGLIAYNLVICYVAHFKEPYFALALLFVIIGLYFFWRKKRDDYEWHMSAAMVTIFCLLAYMI